MSQSKKGSFAETIFNTTVGFAINFVANLLILPMFGFPIKAGPAFHMGLIFTVISVVRGYGVRRLFNRPKFAAFIDNANAYLGVPAAWLKSRFASATSRAPNADHKTTSPDTTTAMATASDASTTNPLMELVEKMAANPPRLVDYQVRLRD